MPTKSTSCSPLGVSPEDCWGNLCRCFDKLEILLLDGVACRCSMLMFFACLKPSNHLPYVPPAFLKSPQISSNLLKSMNISESPCHHMPAFHPSTGPVSTKFSKSAAKNLARYTTAGPLGSLSSKLLAAACGAMVALGVNLGQTVEMERMGWRDVGLVCSVVFSEFQQVHTYIYIS